MLLLTGATGTIGTALLRRLTTAEIPVRCLVRDPRSLGAQRVHVQITLGRLEDPRSFRNALRGVDTVVHLAASIRDQPGATIEELNALATWRLVRAAERAGVERFVFFSSLGASISSPSRFMRAKALAERAVSDSSLSHTIFAPSIVYAPGDPYLRLLRRMSLAPVMPIPGAGRAQFEPIWAEDVADCVLAALPGAPQEVYELAGPERLSHREIVQLALASMHRHRPLLPLPIPLVRGLLKAAERVMGARAFATWEEAELLEIPMLASRGTADAESLGARPRPMREILTRA